ncbi:MAG: hypothetical protein OJF62_000858 [Pseudolabrys sp.]|jgi:hypothetical protein|nr:hypothetical protein [Pseudolabrys sp.]
MRPKLLPAIALALLPAPAFAFSIAVSWAGTKACFDPQSPVIALKDVPGGTATIAFHMQDEDAPNFRHGGGTVRYMGQTSLAKGAFAYKDPARRRRTAITGPRKRATRMAGCWAAPRRR